MKSPALLGGYPTFSHDVPISQPTIPRPNAVLSDVKRVLESRQLTNGPYVRHFEEEVEKKLSVKHAVAMSSCTSGLLLTLRALGVTGEVILPSFTFFATAHAAIWNGLTPVFADCDANTFNVDPASVESLISPKTQAIIGVHIFGNPCDVSALERIARRNHLHLIFDAAHGFGSIHKGTPLGSFGTAAVFSLSPTKTVVAGEGGVVTTSDSRLAESLRSARDYGNSGDYDPEMVGLNARMPEINAILGSVTLGDLDDNIARRTTHARQYAYELREAPGIRPQSIGPNDESSFKDFGILVEEESFGLTRDQLHEALRAEGIMTKKYFSPPVHRQKAYKQYAPKDPLTLISTEYVSSNILCLPMYSHLQESAVSGICDAVLGAHENAAGIRNLLEAPASVRASSRQVPELEAIAG